MKVFPVFLLMFAILPAFASSSRQRGAALFVSAGCEHCHAVRGVGGHRGPDLTDVGRTMKKAAIRDQIIAGGRQMPPFGDLLRPPEVKALVAYLHSCRTRPKK